jgi:hypothetical protein
MANREETGLREENRFHAAITGRQLKEATEVVQLHVL